MKKHRTTVFTRLLIFMVIFLPIAFIAASHIQGKDPKTELLNLINRKETPVTHTQASNEELTIDMLQKEIKNLREELDKCQSQSK